MDGMNKGSDATGHLMNALELPTVLKNDSEVKELQCIEYPANVQNVEKAILNVGGLDRIADAFFKDQKLECKFQNGAIYRKSATGSVRKTNGFVIKVVRKKIQSDSGVSFSYSSSVIGKVVRVIQFNYIADYQYLPVITGNDGKPVNIISDVVPSERMMKEGVRRKCELFLVPNLFTRMDSVYNMFKSKEKSQGLMEQKIKKSMGRQLYVYIIPNDSSDVPAGPSQKLLCNTELQTLINEEELTKIKQCFEERPIWTNHAVRCVTGFNASHMRPLLASVSYRFISGPYRMTWIRYGYDPRKDYNSRIYQIVDYRLRGYADKFWRSSDSRSKLGADFISRIVNKNAGIYHESNYILKPGYLPPSKQVSYQVCDIKLSEVEEMLNLLPASAEEVQYDSKSGWLPTDFVDKIRDIIDNYLKSELQKCLDSDTAENETSAGGVFNEQSDSDDNASDDSEDSIPRQSDTDVTDSDFD